MRIEIKVREERLKLHILGEYLDCDKNAVAIVGTRKMTARGKKLAQIFSEELASKGITIVSGLARGVDTEAHIGALVAGGRTIAVLAHGLDRIYPPENYVLANRIKERGCLITKYDSGTPPAAKNFLERNQLIAGLSKAVLVIEGERRSGTLSTAAHAARMGIEVFAIPGSPATDFLIENGANEAESPDDLLEYLGGQL